jgi:hypothetical protein
MLESFLSKFVMGMCAILIIAAISSSFVSTQDYADERVAIGTLRSLSELIFAVDRVTEPVSLRFDLLPTMCPKFDRLELAPGSISMVGEEGRISVEVPDGLVILSAPHQGKICEKLEAWPPSKIIVERQFADSGPRTVIYVENLDATTVTSSANRSHSSSVL